MQLQKGQKIKLADLINGSVLTVSVSVQMQSGKADIACFGVDGDGKLSDDRYFIFYNQTASPEKAIAMEEKGAGTEFRIDLAKLPASIQRLVITVTQDDMTMDQIRTGSLGLYAQGQAAAEFSFSGANFSTEKALILSELYCKDQVWRMSVVASGFNGGLSALLTHFGGEEAAPAAKSPAPKAEKPPVQQPPKVVSLKKSGDTHKINLSKNSGTIHVNLNWNQTQKGFLMQKKSGIDLDLACMYRLKDGRQGVIQALGNQFGNDRDFPFIKLDKDDRSGTSTDGENMFFTKPELIDFAIVFAFIYEGSPNWKSAHASVTLRQQGSPDVELQIDSANTFDRFCVFASMKDAGGQLEIRREEQYFQGHKEADEYYGFGFRWVAGSK